MVAVAEQKQLSSMLSDILPAIIRLCIGASVRASLSSYTCDTGDTVYADVQGVSRLSTANRVQCIPRHFSIAGIDVSFEMLQFGT